MALVDSHAHLDFPTSLSNGEFRGTSADDLNGWLERAKDEGVNKIICVGTSIEASRKCVEIAERYSSPDLQIYATVGIHAQDGKDDVGNAGSLLQCFKTLKQIATSSGKVVAIGECGYDFYLDGEKRIKMVDKDRQFQKKLFEAQIRLAAELDLPLVVHCRNAWKKTFSLLSTVYGLPTRTGVFHSWTGDWEAAQKVIELGFYISFSGIVTFDNAPDVQDVASRMPLDKMLLETDSPFLSPVPFRGLGNEPKNVKIIAEFVAKLRNLSVGQIEEVTSKNAQRLFGI